MLALGVTFKKLHSLYEGFRLNINQQPKIYFMKKFLFTSAVALAFSVASFAQDSDRETIEGNGKLVTKEVNIQSFDALEANGVYELKLTQGDQETVKIEADENLQEMFTVRNEGSKLVIDTKKLNNKNLKTKTKMRVYVSFKKLKSI